ncbi:MAG: CHAT domain-containing protein, partial [Terriglobales bacterium]
MLSEWQNWLVRFKTLVSQNRPLARLIAPVPNTVQEILKSGKTSKSTVVEYLVGADSSVVFTVEPSGRVAATVLPVTRRQLISQVSALLATSGSTAQDAQRSRTLLQALSNELLPPSVRNFLPKNPEQVVAIIPDGVLLNLPFAALIDQQGRYFIEQHTITLASSIGVFLDSPLKPYSGIGVVVACPVAGNQEASLIFSALGPDQVTRLVGGTDVTGLQEHARGKSIVHLGSNLPITGNPMIAVVPLLPDKDDLNRKVIANRLFGTNMPSDLVVLSGTSVNAKDVQGNAVKCFSRGLNYAGARNVLMSLWLAPDP